jgi:DUF4097 and DUF4098 domain-containing protein YvlB
MEEFAMNLQSGLLPAVAALTVGVVITAPSVLPAHYWAPTAPEMYKVTSYLPPIPQAPPLPGLPKLADFPALPELPALPALPSIPRVPFGEEGHFDRTLTVSGPVDLDVQTGSGDITVKTGDSSKVEVHGKIRTNHGAGADIQKYVSEIEANPPIEQNGNTIHIGRIENENWKHNISISYELVVPAQTKLVSQSGSGSERIDGIAGPLEARSGSGSLKISNIGNEVQAHTGSGEVELSNVKGGAKLSAGSGSISAKGIAGGLNASSGSGSISLEQTAPGDVEIQTGSGSVEVTGANGSVKAQTGSGGISVAGNPAGEWTLHSGSGDVAVKLPPQASFDLVAHTGSGSIDSNREIAVQGKISPRELNGKVGGGGPTVELSTSSGTIEIR